MQKAAGPPPAPESSGNVQFSFNLDKLKILDVNTDYSVVYNALQRDCKSLETLRVNFGMHYNDFRSFFSLLKNSSNTLKQISIDFDNIEDYEIVGFFTNMIHQNLDLNEFSIACIENPRRSLFDFLETQNNLKILKIDVAVDFQFFGYMKGLLETLDLTRLKICLNDVENLSDEEWKMHHTNIPWDLKNLEKIGLHYWEEDSENLAYVLDNVFRFASNALKQISLNGNWHFGKDFIGNIARNYPNLIELKISKNCENLSCNDMPIILKNLKKLKTLKFTFNRNQIDLKLFDDSDDNFVLPDIRNVEFAFNAEFNDQFIAKLLDFIGNTVKFELSGENLSNESLDTITRKLRKLQALKISGGVDQKGLQIIQENMKRFNESPHLFRIDSLTLAEYKKQLDLEENLEKNNNQQKN